jgi:hypothetical protein
VPELSVIYKACCLSKFSRTKDIQLFFDRSSRVLMDDEAAKKIRYVIKQGFVVADDVVRRVMSAEASFSFTGIWLFRLKKPVACVFVSVGSNGAMLDGGSGMGVITEKLTSPTKEENYALHAAMLAFDPEYKLRLRSNWVFIDLEAVEGRLIRRPTEQEIAALPRLMSQAKHRNNDAYRAVSQVSKAGTTDIKVDPNYDSGFESMQRMFDELEEREKKAEKARKERMGDLPDTPAGHWMYKMRKKLVKSQGDAAAAKAGGGEASRDREKTKGKEEVADDEEPETSVARRFWMSAKWGKKRWRSFPQRAFDEAPPSEKRARTAESCERGGATVDAVGPRTSEAATAAMRSLFGSKYSRSPQEPPSLDPASSRAAPASQSAVLPDSAPQNPSAEAEDMSEEEEEQQPEDEPSSERDDVDYDDFQKDDGAEDD